MAMQLGFAILVSDEVHNTIRRIQLAIAQACGSNPALKLAPHVTLKQAFHAKALAPIEDYFDALAAKIEPIELHLRGVDSFEQEGVVFLSVEPNPALEALRLRVLSDLRERFKVKPVDIEDQRYRFHVSLTYELSGESLQRARQVVESMASDFRFPMETLALFCYTGEDWVVYKRSRIAAFS